MVGVQNGKNNWQTLAIWPIILANHWRALNWGFQLFYQRKILAGWFLYTVDANYWYVMEFFSALVAGSLRQESIWNITLDENTPLEKHFGALPIFRKKTIYHLCWLSNLKRGWWLRPARHVDTAAWVKDCVCVYVCVRLWAHTLPFQHTWACFCLRALTTAGNLKRQDHSLVDV